MGIFMLIGELLKWDVYSSPFTMFIMHQDTETYKASVKEDMQRWQSVLRLHGSSDWLIVVVESDGKKKNKTNILPRTSIMDKIRNDFCNKQSDRWGWPTAAAAQPKAPDPSRQAKGHLLASAVLDWCKCAALWLSVSVLSNILVAVVCMAHTGLI